MSSSFPLPPHGSDLSPVLAPGLPVVPSSASAGPASIPDPLVAPAGKDALAISASVIESAKSKPSKTPKALDITRDVDTIRREYCPIGSSKPLTKLREELRTQEDAKIDKANRSTLFKNLALLATAAAVVIVCTAVLSAIALSGGIAVPLLAAGIGIGAGLLAYGTGNLIFDIPEDKEATQLSTALKDKEYLKFIENLADKYVRVEISDKSPKEIEEAVEEAREAHDPLFISKEFHAQLMNDKELLSKWQAVNNGFSKPDELRGKIQVLEHHLAFHYGLYRTEPLTIKPPEKGGKAVIEDERKIEAEEEQKFSGDRLREEFIQNVADVVTPGQFFYLEKLPEWDNKYYQSLVDQIKRNPIRPKPKIDPRAFPREVENILRNYENTKDLSVLSNLVNKKAHRELLTLEQENQLIAILERIGFHKI